MGSKSGRSPSPKSCLESCRRRKATAPDSRAERHVLAIWRTVARLDRIGWQLAQSATGRSNMVNSVAALIVGLLLLGIVGLSVIDMPLAKAQGADDAARTPRVAADPHSFGNLDQ